jgi:hypothetical protein
MTRADAHSCGYPGCKTQPTMWYVYRMWSRWLCKPHGEHWLKIVESQQVRPKEWKR